MELWGIIALLLLAAALVGWWAKRHPMESSQPEDASLEAEWQDSIR